MALDTSCFNGWNVCPIRLLTDNLGINKVGQLFGKSVTGDNKAADRDPIRVLLSDALCLCFALLCKRKSLDRER